MAIGDNNKGLTDEAKAAVIDSGTLASLKQVSHDTVLKKEDFDDLKQQAQAAIENIQQMLDSGKLDDATSQKLNAALAKLRAAVGKDGMTRSAISAVLSEASTAMTSTDGADKATSLQQKTEQLWQRIEADNKDVDDDFEKMRKAGVVFNSGLYTRHKQLMEDLQAHPHDINKQKELDAVDDAMLVQAESQIGENSNATPPFDDAKKKSKDRHELVDKDLATITKGKESVTANKDADWEVDTAQGKQAVSNEISMNDVTLQSVGHKQKPPGQQHT